MKELVYLKPNLVLEPLVMNWYAWSHLVSPATAAMNITKRHLEIMNSYIESPEVHNAAVKDPKMKGGPFMDLEGNKVEEIRALLAATLEEQNDMVELSFAFRKLDKMLKAAP